MSPDLLPSIVSGLTEALVGLFLGIFATLLTIRLQRSRKVIEYEIFSMPLLRFKPKPNRAISFTADQSLLTGDDKDKGNQVQINNAYGFEINLLNKGNEAVVQPSIEIRLDGTAKILEYETEPSSVPGYEVVYQFNRQEPYLLRIAVPFINSGERLLIRIISTENRNPRCDVRVIGVGVKTYSRPLGRDVLRILIASIPLWIVFAFIYWGDDWLPSFVVSAIGAHVETDARLGFPLWVGIIGYLLLIIVTTQPGRSGRRGAPRQTCSRAVRIG